MSAATCAAGMVAVNSAVNASRYAEHYMQIGILSWPEIAIIFWGVFAVLVVIWRKR